MHGGPGLRRDDGANSGMTVLMAGMTVPIIR
jgi:hypothetical protein